MTVKMKVSVTLTQPDVPGESESMTTTIEVFGMSLPAVRKEVKRILTESKDIGALPFDEKESDA